MEHESETQASKYPKLSNSKLESSNTGNAIVSSNSSFLGMGEVGGGNRLRDWQNSSRIIRVSRASGGKDRHSKVWTAKGPRDRRVRLSVNTAIQFYDLQDRLGVDQPSKAVEWLIKAASDAISELPSLNSSFPDTPSQQMSGNGIANDNDEQGGFDSSAELEIVQTQTNVSKSSACSSTSETSKGSRNEIRVKARERARERAAKDKESEVTNNQQQQQQQLPQSSSSFTQLLTSGIGNINTLSTTGLMISNAQMHQQQHMMSLGGDQNNNSHELQHFPFIADHHLIVPAPSADHYNLNFSISPSSSIAAFNNNRGTLQSNSLLPHFQRFPSSHQLDGSTLPFFLGAAVENQHHQHQHQHQNHHPNSGQFPSGLQLCYGDNGGVLSDQKGKGKN